MEMLARLVQIRLSHTQPEMDRKEGVVHRMLIKLIVPGSMSGSYIRSCKESNCKWDTLKLATCGLCNPSYSNNVEDHWNLCPLFARWMDILTCNTVADKCCKWLVCISAIHSSTLPCMCNFFWTHTGFMSLVTKALLVVIFFALSNPNKNLGYTQIFSWHTSNRFHNKVWENDYQYIQRDIYPSREMILKS